MIIICFAFVGFVFVCLLIVGWFGSDPDRRRRQASRRIMDRNRDNLRRSSKRRSRSNNNNYKDI